MARWLALGGVLGPLLFIVMTIIASLMRPGYDHVSSFISALGADGTPRAAMMNYGAFLPAGMLLTDFGVGLLLGLPKDRMMQVAAILVMVFGTGMLVDGLASCDPGCPNVGSRENGIHNAVAPIAFISIIAAIGILGVRFRRWPEWKGVSSYSLISSVLALVFLAAVVSSLQTRDFTGLWQRLMLGTMFLWCIVIGARLFRLTGERSRSAP